jgi:hypothetical protein
MTSAAVNKIEKNDPDDLDEEEIYIRKNKKKSNDKPRK